jgi:hypothetical protein
MARAPEITAKILELVHTKNYNGTGFCMYTLTRRELALLAKVPRLTDDYIKEVNKCLLVNDYELIQHSDYCIVVNKEEVNLLRFPPKRLLKKYKYKGQKDELRIEKEYASEMAHEFGFGYGDKRNYDESFAGD